MPAATVETEREVDDAKALARATARFALRSAASLLRRCWSATCRDARHSFNPEFHGCQARHQCYVMNSGFFCNSVCRPPSDDNLNGMKKGQMNVNVNVNGMKCLFFDNVTVDEVD